MPEKRALQFFYQRTSSQLSGFYSCEFWNTSVLQIASWDDGIRHGLVALASLHEEYEKKKPASIPSSANRFVLVQYNLAIRQHLEKVQVLDLPENVEVFVASCLIFICIEVGTSFQSLRELAKWTSDDAWPLRISPIPGEEGTHYIRWVLIRHSKLYRTVIASAARSL